MSGTVRPCWRCSAPGSSTRHTPGPARRRPRPDPRRRLLRGVPAALGRTAGGRRQARRPPGPDDPLGRRARHPVRRDGVARAGRRGGRGLDRRRRGRAQAACSPAGADGAPAGFVRISAAAGRVARLRRDGLRGGHAAARATARPRSRTRRGCSAASRRCPTRSTWPRSARPPGAASTTSIFVGADGIVLEAPTGSVGLVGRPDAAHDPDRRHRHPRRHHAAAAVRAGRRRRAGRRSRRRRPWTTCTPRTGVADQQRPRAGRGRRAGRQASARGDPEVDAEIRGWADSDFRPCREKSVAAVSSPRRTVAVHERGGGPELNTYRTREVATS